jgi:hypothetical protein
MAFWLEAVFGIPYGARDKVRQLAQQVEWVAASTRDNRHAFLTKTKRRKKGRLRQPRAEGAAGEGWTDQAVLLEAGMESSAANRQRAGGAWKAARTVPG